MEPDITAFSDELEKIAEFSSGWMSGREVVTKERAKRALKSALLGGGATAAGLFAGKMGAHLLARKAFPNMNAEQLSNVGRLAALGGAGAGALGGMVVPRLHRKYIREADDVEPKTE